MHSHAADLKRNNLTALAEKSVFPKRAVGTDFNVRAKATTDFLNIFMLNP
jgi:hypothetical protein